MRKLTVILLFITFNSWAQKATDAAKMTLAKQKLYAGEYVSALNMYREIEKDNPRDDRVKYYLGLCQYNLKQIANAKESLLKAVELNPKTKPDVHFLLGKIYQGEENYDKAIEELSLYKNAAT